MFVRISGEHARRASLLSDLGIPGEAEHRISLMDFTYRKGKVICVENDPVEYVYQVTNGAVRSYKTLSDGRRQINAFHLPGDLFGLGGGIHRFTAEAVIDTTLRLTKRENVASAAATDSVIWRNLLEMLTANLKHAEDHMLLLGRKSALERVAAFLCEMDERLSAAKVMSLPMSRRDIADYLGLTIETVSRQISHLQDEGAIDFVGETHREIIILDRGRLAALDTPG